MTRLWSLLSLLLLFGLGACQSTDYMDVPRYTAEQFLNTISIGGSSFSPDETKILYSSDEPGIYNAYTIPVHGGKATQLTHSDSNSVFIYSYFPNDERFLFRSDQGGNELWHIYLRKRDGSITDLTPYEGRRAVFYGWAHDQESFYFGSNRRDKRYMDIYEMDIRDFEAEMIYQNDAGYTFGGISNNERYMALGKTITMNNSNIYLLDRQTGETSLITDHEGIANYSPADFSVDSESLYWLTNEGSEFTYLERYDISTGEREKIYSTDWNVMYMYFSRHGKYRVIGVNADARTEIQVWNTEAEEQVDLPELPEAQITSVNIAPSEEKMAFYVNGSRSPNNLYTYDFSTGEVTRLTQSLNPDIEPQHLVDAEIVRYESFDGLEIPALLYKPHQIEPGEKAPAVVKVHGGPGGQARIGYDALVQYLVNHGYVVIDVNNRGSSGYGKSFYQADDRKHGDEDLRDCVEAKDFLAATGYVDTSRVGILGGSYGGYMVLAALTFQPNAFDCGVDIFGISNWIRTLESIPSWWEARRKALYKEIGHPEKDREYLRSISPLFHAENIIQPLMVIQGANDPRVIKEESDDIVQAVKENDVPVEYIVFEDEGHGFLKKENRIEAYKSIGDFLDQHL